MLRWVWCAIWLIGLLAAPAFAQVPYAPDEAIGAGGQRVIAGSGIAVSRAGNAATVSTAGGVTKDAVAHTVTAAEWASCWIFDYTGSQTLTLPVVTSLSANGCIYIKAQGNITVTLQPNAADGVNGGTAGASVTILGDYQTLVTTTGASGTTALQTPRGIIAGSGITLTRNTDGTITLAASGVGTLIPNSIGGCGLSNDGGTPNTILDIAACTAADSTNASFITQASAFTKSISGAWAAGSGSNGMGNGLTATLNTWYHVCFGNSDYWFDTAATCTNRPGGLSGGDKRRIGAILLDGSVHILGFKQKGDLFVWNVPITNASAQTYSTSNMNVTLSAPLGVPSEVAVNLFVGSNGSDALFLYDPDATTSSNYAACSQQSVNTRCSVIVTPSIAGSIVAVGTGAGNVATVSIATARYRDFRGQ